MISVKRLMTWCEEHAVGRSPSYPKGWICSADLMELARKVNDCEPLSYDLREETDDKT